MFYKGVFKVFSTSLQTKAFKELPNKEEWCYNTARKYIMLFDEQSKCKEEILKIVQVLV